MPAAPRPSHVEVGDIVLVKMELEVRRPLIVASVQRITIGQRATPTTAEVPTTVEQRVSGVIICEPEDQAASAIRAIALGGPGDPARITGRPDRLLPLCYGELLAEGDSLGQWIPRPTRLSSEK